MQLVNEKDDVSGAANLVHHGFDALFKLPAVFGAGDHQRQVQRNKAPVAEQFGHVARRNLLRQALDDGGLANARLTQEHRVILRAAAEDLNHALDFALPADDRVHFPLAGDLRQITAESLQRGRLDLAFLLGGGLPGDRFARDRLIRRREVGIQLLQDFLAGQLDIHVQVFEHARRDPIAFAEQAQQNMLGAHVSMVQGLGLLLGEREHLLHAGGVGDAPHHLLIGARANLLFHFQAHRVQIEPQFLQHVDGHPLAQLD